MNQAEPDPRQRVLIIIKNLQQGGTEQQVLRLLASLDRERFDARLCIIQDEIHLPDVPAHLPLIRLSRRHYNRATRRAILQAIESFRPHLIHSFRDQVNFHVRLALRGCSYQPALLTSVRGRPMYPQHLAVERWLSRRNYRITVNSLGVAHVLTHHGRVPKERIAHTPNLIPTHITPPTRDARAAARAGLGLDGDALVMLVPGRIAFVKNQLGLLAALGILQWRGVLDSRLVVLFAGRVRDKPAAWLMRGLAALLGRDLAARTRLLGMVSNMTPLYHAADLVVLPSVCEGMPNVTLEAHLSGLPVVTTREANRDDLVRPGLSGEVADGSTPRALARALARMLRTPAETWPALGAAGRSHILERFAPDAMLARVHSLYLEAIAAQYRE